SARAAVGEVRHRGLLVNRSAHAMPAQLANHTEARPAYLAFHRPPDFVNTISRACRGERLLERPLRAVRQLAAMLRDRRDIHRKGGIRVETILLRHQIELDQVARTDDA